MGMNEPKLLPNTDEAIKQSIHLALDGFFFTINHNFELDFVSDNVAQYLKFTQEELAGRSLYHCVHLNDVGEFSKAWAKKDSGDPLTTPVNNDQQTVQSRGRTFLCRMRTNDDSTPYIRMVVSVALHRDSLGSDKTFLICIARRPSLNDSKDKPSLLGFDQFSSRINLNYDIENLDSSHMKCEKIDMNFHGKNFRDYVHTHDIPAVELHFTEVIENGEGKSTVYRFCLHDNTYAFINTRSKLFPNSITGKQDSILSTHTIVRLIENNLDLNGNASTRLMKSIISSNRDLQRNKQQTPNKTHTTSSTPPPIGTQFALTMLGMHRNASNSLQQHVSSTLGTLIQVQNSLSTSTNSNEKIQSEPPSPAPNRLIAQKSSTLDNVSSSGTVEFGSKRPPISPAYSNHGSLSSPANSFDIFFSSSTPTSQPTNSNDLYSLLSSPTRPKTSSPHFSTNDIYTTSSSPKPPSISSQTPSRNSRRLRQLLTNKSPSTNDNPSQTLHYHPDIKLEDLIQGPESPTTTHVSPLTDEYSSAIKRQRKHSSALNESANTTEILLKKVLNQQNSFSSSPGRTESIHSDDSSSSKHATKQRSDTFLRTLLNDEVRPQKVVVETPFAVGSRSKLNQRSSSSTNVLIENNHTPTTLNTPNQSFDIWNNNNNNNNKSKRKQRQHSNSFGNQNTPLPRKPGRPKREPSDYLLATPDYETPQSVLSDNSLDALLDSSVNLDQPLIQTSPIVLRRTTRKTSTSNLKRLLDNSEHVQNPRKYPKLLTQALKDKVKVECQDHSIISPSTAIAATRPLNQLSQTIIKTEPEIFDHNSLFDKPPPSSLRPQLHRAMPNPNSQSTLLRTLIRTPQTPTLTTKKDGPLYDLLQNLETTSTPSSRTNSTDLLEQYLTPVLSQTSTTNNHSSKDDYLAALLNSDPQQPTEISLIPTTKQQIANETNRITSIANDLYNSTATIANNANDDFLSLLENKDFLECLNESSTIDTILSQNSTSLIEQTFPSTKRSEKDEKAISEIYKTLVTSFNPSQSQQSSSTNDSVSVDNNPFNSLTGDFLFNENTNSNRSINSDSYNQSSVPQYSYPSNNTQFSDCLSMDLLDNSSSYPPNVTLPLMNNSYQSSPTTVMNTNSMMMYSQHPNIHYRQPSQQQAVYNNYSQSSPNQPAPNYYSMPSGAQQQQQRMSPASHHPSQLAKRQTSMQPQRTSSQINQQQVQLHMSMNVTLPHMTPNQQQIQHRPMMNTYNDLMMPNNNGPPLQQDYHQYSNNNTLDLLYNSDPFMAPSANMGQQSTQNRHINVMQHQQTYPQATMHQPYSNMSVALSATIQQNSHNSNNLMNTTIPNLTTAECRQSEELNNQMMNCLSFQPSRCTSEFVRKQLQNTIHGRQKPPGGKDMSSMTGHNSLSANLDSNQKGAYFRSQLSSQMSTPPLQTTMRPQQ